MCKDLYHEGEHMALVGQTRGVVKLWRFFFLIKVSQTQADKARILPSNLISLVNNLTIMGSLRYDKQAQV